MSGEEIAQSDRIISENHVITAEAGHSSLNDKAVVKADNRPGGKGDIADNKVIAVKKEIDKNHSVDYIDLGKILDDLNGDEKTVAETIGHLSLHIDDIIVRTGLPSHKVLAALTMLEIAGCAVRDNGNNFSLSYSAE